MAAIGLMNELEVLKTVDFGVYLDGGPHGEILMPKRYVPENCQVGDTVEVFIYLDSEDRLVATTDKPYVMVGEFAKLKVVSTTAIGAFLDWGLPKDLLVPFREQQVKMEEGKSYLVFVYLDDESQRIVASSKLDKFVDNIPVDYEVGEEVDLIIAGQTDMGYKAIIDNSHWGLIFKNEVFQPLKIGDKLKGFIKNIRPDEKIDLSLEKAGYEKIDSISQSVLDKLKEANGFLPFNDKSDPDVISKTFGISKKNFKKAIGALYKQRLINIEDQGIRLAD
ncbi:CvfB family protein [Gaoshiqia sediminis]|uniref:S1-like domain-containing RNA-binding protein n=1 Tax=Gaoshiqia sediminis TaxID=2986998 RepID=A0AA41YC21_9BACT|nr:S1-like domain-containing RNA-binding protein [Gaoshiqia sediminis]MCW0483548.1 S1-like domain-containing RNA-binding protein [Gaoshiqia sediminis]